MHLRYSVGISNGGFWKAAESYRGDIAPSSKCFFERCAFFEFSVEIGSILFGFMDFSGVPRCVIPNIYLLPWFETPLRSKAPLKCTMSMVSVLVKDLRVARKRGSNRALTFKRRQILRRAASVLTKGALAKSKAQPAKKSKNAKPAPMIYEKWPVFRPFDVFSALVSAGMVSELCHVCNCKYRPNLHSFPNPYNIGILSAATTKIPIRKPLTV